MKLSLLLAAGGFLLLSANNIGPSFAKQSNSTQQSTVPANSLITTKVHSVDKSTQVSPANGRVTIKPAQDLPPKYGGLITKAPANGRPTSAPVNGRPTKASVAGRPTSAPANGRQTKAPVNGRPKLAPVSGRQTIAPANGRPTSVPVAGRPTFSPAHGRPTKAPVAGRQTKTPVNGGPTSSPVNGRPTKGPVAGRQTKAPVNGRPTSAPVNGRPTSAPVVGRQTKAPAAGRQTKAPVNGRPTSAPINGRPTKAPINGRPTSGPISGRQTKAPINGRPTVAPSGVTKKGPIPLPPPPPPPPPPRPFPQRPTVKPIPPPPPPPLPPPPRPIKPESKNKPVPKAFDPNPSNFKYLDSKIFLADLNDGKLDQQLVENGHTKLQEDSRAIGPPRDFGLQSCSANLVAENPNLAELNIRQSGCPADFDTELLGLINNARARHQAPPLALVRPGSSRLLGNNFGDNFADQSAKAADEYTRPNYAESGQGVVQLTYTLLRSAPDLHANLTSAVVAKALYSPGLSQYHSYGSEPPSRHQAPVFTALIWKSASQVGIGCTTFHTFDAATKVRLIDTKVNVVLTLGASGAAEEGGVKKDLEHVNGQGKFSVNVLPPNDITWSDYVVNVQSEDHILIEDDDDDDDDDDYEEEKQKKGKKKNGKK